MRPSDLALAAAGSFRKFGFGLFGLGLLSIVPMFFGTPIEVPVAAMFAVMGTAAFTHANMQQRIADLQIKLDMKLHHLKDHI